MDESLQLSQTQRLQQALSPLQVRYGRLLEMSAPELEDEVRRELDDNPALEVAAEGVAAEGGIDDDFNETSEQLQLADYGSEDDIPSYRLNARNYSPDDVASRAEIAQGGESLHDSLLRQLGELDLSDIDALIARYIIGNLDDNGYLTRDPQELADDLAITAGVDVATADVRRMLGVVRSLEPAGVGAVDLRDCLLLQLRRRPDTSPIAIEIVRDYFDLFSKMHFDRLAGELGIDRGSLDKAVDEIRSLNPKPGGAIDPATEQSIVPDFAITTDGDGSDSIEVAVLSYGMPELEVSASFRLSNEPFVKRKRQDAEAFISLLRQRRLTMLRIISAMARLQHDFFVSGDASTLRPMVLRDIAAVTGDDLSVISRAMAGKYVVTPTGVYPTKFFFNEGVKAPTAPDAEGAETTTVSQHAVHEAIKRLIAAEDKSHPLSDEALCRLLAEEGFPVARRTVAKYREALGLPVARLRKLR